MTEFKEISQAIIEGNSEKAEVLTKQSLDNGISPLDIFRQGLVPGMGVVGEKMKAGDYYIPEVLMSAAAMKPGVETVCRLSARLTVPPSVPPARRRRRRARQNATRSGLPRA